MFKKRWHFPFVFSEKISDFLQKKNKENLKFPIISLFSSKKTIKLIIT